MILPSIVSSSNQMASPTSQSQGPPVAPLQPAARRPLRREGAQYFPSATEQALEAAMMRSSSPLDESPLGKRVREGNDSGDHDDTEPDEESPSITETQQQSLPSFSNVIAATLRYASRKKLRPEQRDEVEEFLSVNSWTYAFLLNNFLKHSLGYSDRSSGQIIYVYSLIGE